MLKEFTISFYEHSQSHIVKSKAQEITETFIFLLQFKTQATWSIQEMYACVKALSLPVCEFNNILNEWQHSHNHWCWSVLVGHPK